MVVGLPEIVARVAKSEWDEALDLALVAWRDTRAPAYANLIDAISSKISRAAIPVRAGYFGEYRMQWAYRARSLFAVDIPVLLDGFGLDLESRESRTDFDSTSAGKRLRTALEKENATIAPGLTGPFLAIALRLEILAGFKPDPRTAKGLVRFLKLAPIVADGPLWVATYGPIFDFIEAVGDVRILPALAALPPSSARDRTIAALEARVIPPLGNEKEVMALAKELGFTEAAPPVDVKELLELVVADPNDDTPRAILGDLWLEAGDPRGEFVQLELRAARSELTATELDRMASLEAQNVVEWLGELALITSSRRFYRGFLDEFALSADRTVPLSRWQAAMADVRLGTVRTIRRGAASDGLFLEWLFAPALCNLEEAEIATPKMFRQISEAKHLPPKLRRVELAMELAGIESARAQVEPLVSRGLSVSIRFERVDRMADYFPLLALATEKSHVVLHGIDARFTASRGAAGLTLDVVTRDADLVLAAISATRGAAVKVSRPRGAKLYGPDATTRRLASFSKAIRDRPLTFDASWTDMLRR